MYMSNKSKTTAALTCMMMLMLACVPAFGQAVLNDKAGGGLVLQVPNILNYQGFLTDTLGNTLTDTVIMEMSIYTDSTAGSQVWSEIDWTVPVLKGIFNNILGDVDPIPDSVLLNDLNRWLQIRVNGTILLPRTRITAVAYAYGAKHAQFANFADNAPPDGDWMIDGDEMHSNVMGSVGIGMDNPSDSAKFHVLSHDRYAGLFTSDSVSAYTHVIHAEYTGSNVDATGVYGRSVPGDYYGFGGRFVGGYIGVLGEVIPTGAAAYYGVWGSTVGGSGTNFGVFGEATGSGTNFGVFGEATGSGTNWAGYFVGNTCIMGTLGLGTSTPSSETKMHVRAATDNFGILIDAEGTSGSQIGLHAANTNYSSLAKNAYFTTDWQRFSTANGAFLQEIDGNGFVYFKTAGSGTNPISWNYAMILGPNGKIGMGKNPGAGKLEVYNYGRYAGMFYSDSVSDTTRVLYSEVIGTGSSIRATAVCGKSRPADFYGCGGMFEGGRYGLYAVVNPTGSQSYWGSAGSIIGCAGTGYGIDGYAGGTGTCYGIRGSASGGTSYGIYGSVSSAGPTQWAGYFSGNVHVTGTLSKGSGSFLIDHPLDPANKTLRHNFVESPENLCLYRGKIKLSNKGEATVKLPDYFAALTKENEASINLTPVGRPFLTGCEWKPNHTGFIVYGDAGREVYYIVLADRDDPVIRQLSRPVEQEKGKGHFVPKGKLLYPTAYGYPESDGADYEERQNLMREHDLMSGKH